MGSLEFLDMTTNKLFTIGYEGKSIEVFIEELLEKNICVLVDVRLTPLSRKPGFAKRRLATELAKHNIEYLHFPALGNPKDNRNNFRATRSGSAAMKFRRLMRRDSDDVLYEIANMSKRKKIALMCFEHDAMCCHRTVVAELVAEKDAVIEVVAV